MNEIIELSNKLFSQAIKEAGISIGKGVYGATPPAMGEIIERYLALCKEHNLNPLTGELTNNQTLSNQETLP